MSKDWQTVAPTNITHDARYELLVNKFLAAYVILYKGTHYWGLRIGRDDRLLNVGQCNDLKKAMENAEAQIKDFITQVNLKAKELWWAIPGENHDSAN